MSLRSLPRWLTAAVGVLIVAALLGGGYYLIRDSSLMEVERVTVDGANGYQAAEIRARLKKAGVGMSSLNPDVAALRASVDDLPTVKSISVDRKPPHRLVVTVEEERPIAALQSGSRKVAVSSEGALLPGVPTANLPVVPTRGELTRDAPLRSEAKLVIKALSLAPIDLKRRVRFGGVSDENGLTFQLDTGVTLRFGTSERLNAKWLAAQGVLGDPEAADATYIDLRAPDRPAAGGVVPQGEGETTATTTAPVDPNPQVPVEP